MKVCFSKSKGLPLLVILENNNQSMSSTIAERRCPIDVAKICEALELLTIWAK